MELWPIAESKMPSAGAPGILKLICNRLTLAILQFILHISF